MSENTMRKYLQEDLGTAGVTVHGFRSTFRDWVAEKTIISGAIAEAALAHVLRDKTEAAYQRGDMFDRRRELMQAWSDYCVASSRARVATATRSGQPSRSRAARRKATTA